MGSGEGLGRCFVCIKYLLFAFNFIFWLLGCALVGFGIWVLVDDTFKNLAADSAFAVLQYAGVGLIAVGCVMMVIGFFGCCGAIRESKCLLIMFFICMFILFVGLVTVGVMCIVYKTEFIDKVAAEFKKQVETYRGDKSELVNTVQKIFSCCGSENTNEYNSYVQENGALPETCPRSENDATVVAKGTLPCKEKAFNLLNEYGLVLGGVCIGVGSVMLVGLVFSMLLCCAIKQTYDD